MWRTVGAFFLVLVSAWTLRAEPLHPEPVIQTQENFDLGKVSLKQSFFLFVFFFGPFVAEISAQVQI